VLIEQRPVGQLIVLARLVVREVEPPSQVARPQPGLARLRLEWLRRTGGELLHALGAAGRYGVPARPGRAPGATRPTFIDCHPSAAVPSAVRHQLHLEVARGLIDAHGVQALGRWLTNGVIYCVLRVPSPEAFCRHHAERGLRCDDVHQLADLGAVTHAIAELWPADQYVDLAS
jgi:hypothetical protein